MSLCASVCMCFVVACWEMAGLLALVCHFPSGILGQVWYLIVWIPDLFTLTYFYGQSIVFKTARSNNRFRYEYLLKRN